MTFAILIAVAVIAYGFALLFAYAVCREAKRQDEMARRMFGGTE
jgi:hypothetical protein